MTLACPSEPFHTSFASVIQASSSPGQRLWSVAGELCGCHQQSRCSTGYSSQHWPTMGTPAAVSRWPLGPLVCNKHERPENTRGSCRQVLQHSSRPEQSPKKHSNGTLRASGDIAWMVPPHQLCWGQYSWQGPRPHQGMRHQLWRAQACTGHRWSFLPPHSQCSFANTIKHEHSPSVQM